MTKDDLFQLKIEKRDQKIYDQAIAKWDSLSKPIDGLGDFEREIAKIASIQKRLIPCLNKRCAIILCGDNGIVEEGISQSPKEITKSVAINLGNGTSSACTMARSADVKILPVDIGIDSSEEIPGVINRKVAFGTRNFLKENALTEEETLKAIQVGMDLVNDIDADIILTGEMGIGNTTTATTLLCFLLDLDPFAYTGRGAGLDDSSLKKKREVVTEGVSILKRMPDDGKVFQALQRIGGLDIAGLAGVFLGAGLKRKPVIIDGLISAAAAVIAAKLCENAKDYMLASHEGREGAILPALQYLNCKPLIKGNMALGEGTGAIMTLPLLDMAFNFYMNASSFEEVDIDAYQRYDQ